MDYLDIKGRPVPYNPYISSGNAASLADTDYKVEPVYTDFINSLITDVKQCIKNRIPIKWILIGEFGYGKTTLLNLISQEFDNSKAVCIPIKFQELVTPIAAISSSPVNQFGNLLGAILLKISDILKLSDTDKESVFKRYELINIFDAFSQLLAYANNNNILITFDEVEVIFSTLDIQPKYFISFLHSLSEMFSKRQNCSLCVCITDQIKSDFEEATQLVGGRFSFKYLRRLNKSEIRNYIEIKNESVTLRKNEPIYPFNEEIIDFVSSVSVGVPRFIEIMCNLIWEEGQSNQKIEKIDLNNARRFFINNYINEIDVYISRKLDDINNFFKDALSEETKQKFTSIELSEEIKAFFKILFYTGGEKITIDDMLPLINSSPIQYFQQLSIEQAKRKLQKGAREIVKRLSEEKNAHDLDENIKLKQYISVFGQRNRKFSLQNSVFEDIFKSKPIM